MAQPVSRVHRLPDQPWPRQGRQPRRNRGQRSGFILDRFVDHAALFLPGRALRSRPPHTPQRRHVRRLLGGRGRAPDSRCTRWQAMSRSCWSLLVHNWWSMGSAQRGLLPCDAMVINAVLSLAVAVVMLISPRRPACVASTSRRCHAAVNAAPTAIHRKQCSGRLHRVVSKPKIKLITQRSQVQILSPLLQMPLSESLSVLRRKGPDHSWQQFGSKRQRARDAASTRYAN